MKLTYRLLFISFLWQTLLFAQKNTDKSLSLQSNIDSINQVAFKLKNRHIDSALTLILLTRNLSDEINYKKGLSYSYFIEAGIYQHMGYGKRALSIYLQSLNISESINDSLGIAKANQQIANSLYESKKYIEARILFKNSLTIFYSLNEIEDVINIKNSLGLIELKLNKIHAADSLFKTALNKSEEINYQYGKKKALFNLGLLNSQQNNFKIAEPFFQSSLNINNELGDSYGIASDKIQIASLFQRNNNCAKAINLSSEAYFLSKKINALELAIDASISLKNCYAILKKYEQSIQWQDTIISIQKTMSVSDKNFAVDFINVLKNEQVKQIEYEKKLSAAKANSKMQVVIIIITLIAFLIVLFVSILWYRNYRKAEYIGHELLQKSELINSNSVALQNLNEQIVLQNKNLEESNLMKDRLITIISHDLRHPLVNTKSLIEVIYNKFVSGEETIGLLNQLDKQYLKSISMLDNLLFWIRSKINGVQIDKKRVPLFQFSENIIHEFLSSLLEKNIEVVNTISEELFVYADVEMLKIVLRNLISNSIKFTLPKGEIKISAEVFQESVHIYITDNGLGITRENLEKIKNNKHFTNKGTNNETGSGFGLLLCKDLITAQSGKLEINSVPHQGTTFTITLPFVEV